MRSYSEQMEEQLEPRREWGVRRSEFFPEPTAHEVWVRNYIPRGAHYDTADDGPETDRRFQIFVAAVVKVVTEANFWDVLSDKWLDAHSHDFGGLDGVGKVVYDILHHGRE